MIARYEVSFRVNSNDKLETYWGTGKMIYLSDALEEIQKLIDQLASNPEWRNGAVLAYNALSSTSSDSSKP